MGRKKKNQKNRKKEKSRKIKEKGYPIFTSRLKRWMTVLGFIVTALIVTFAFFNKAGRGGRFLTELLNALIGKAMFFLPPLLIIAGVLFLKPDKKRLAAPVITSLFLFTVGIAGILNIRAPEEKGGGVVGYLASWPFFHYFGTWVSLIIFFSFITAALLIIWEFLPTKKIFRSSKKKLFSGTASLSDISAKKKGGALETKESEFKIKPIRAKKESLPLATKVLFKTKEQGPKKVETKPLLRKKGKIGQNHQDENYKKPPLELLRTFREKPATGDIEQNQIIIQNTLANFGIPVEMGEVNVGPTVTQYTLKPAEGVRLTKITALARDLALALAAHPIRIEAPIPGRSLVGIEVPNKQRAVVTLGEIIASEEFQESPSPLALALGRDVAGQPVIADLSKMPHLLVAGATGSGKTICLQSIILSLLYRNSPQFLKLILVDPKRVEFPNYENLPHLLAPVIYTAPKTVNVLNWLVGEMERRFDVLAELKTRDIATFNETLLRNPKLKEEFYLMPYIVLVIDELADLMAAKGKEIEVGIVRLSQMARAVGIHLIVATQRPSVEVITGLIKANITSRIAFQVASQVDSRTILDMSGAESLLGNGDMLFVSSESSKPKRVQGSFVSQKEVKKITDFIKKNNPLEEIESQTEFVDLEKEINQQTEKSSSFYEDEEQDPLLSEAKRVILEYDRASASLLQRRLSIGYARAARILDILEKQGFVGPAEGSKPRKVLIGQATNNEQYPPQNENSNHQEVI